MNKRATASDRGRRRGRLGVAALVVGLGAVGVAVWRSGSSSGQASGPIVFETVVVGAPVTPPNNPGQVSSTVVVADVTTTSNEVVAPTDDAVAPPTTATATPALAVVGAPRLSVPADVAQAAAAFSVIENGTMYLRGTVPDEATAKRMVDEMTFRKGGAVTSELTIDASAPQPTTVPLYVPTAALFDAGGAKLLEGIGPTLDVVSSLLRNGDNSKLLIRGHTDDQGSEAYNFALSQQRVAAVLAYLVGAGVDPTRLVVEPRGEVEPIADNSTVDGRAKNRRVELVLVPA